MTSNTLPAMTFRDARNAGVFAKLEELPESWQSTSAVLRDQVAAAQLARDVAVADVEALAQQLREVKADLTDALDAAQAFADGILAAYDFAEELNGSHPYGRHPSDLAVQLRARLTDATADSADRTRPLPRRARAGSSWRDSFAEAVQLGAETGTKFSVWRIADRWWAVPTGDLPAASAATTVDTDQDGSVSRG